jgi:DNA-directed RNA polymerase beta subunit
MQDILNNLDPHEFELINGEQIKVSIENCEIKAPRVVIPIDATEKRVFPAEARQRATTYTGNCTITIQWSKNKSRMGSLEFDLGMIPIMIRVSTLKFYII